MAPSAAGLFGTTSPDRYAGRGWRWTRSVSVWCFGRDHRGDGRPLLDRARRAPPPPAILALARIIEGLSLGAIRRSATYLKARLRGNHRVFESYSAVSIVTLIAAAHQPAISVWGCMQRFFLTPEELRSKGVAAFLSYRSPLAICLCSGDAAQAP